jgi:phenylacetate-CoA ligase
VVGRQEDVLLFPDGRGMMRCEFLFKDLPGVAEAQVVQESLTHLVINIVPSVQYGGSEANMIRTRMLSRYDLGQDYQIEVRRLEKIPRERNGKFRPVISHIDVQSVGQTAARANNNVTR